jgi:hypothetical protein
MRPRLALLVQMGSEALVVLGRPLPRALGLDLGEARKFADRIRAQIRAGTFALATPAAPSDPGAPTLKAYGAIFFEHRPRGRGTHRGRTRDKAGNEASMLNGSQGCPIPMARRCGSDDRLHHRGHVEAALAALRAAGRAASTRNKVSRRQFEVARAGLTVAPHHSKATLGHAKPLADVDSPECGPDRAARLHATLRPRLHPVAPEASSGQGTASREAARTMGQRTRVK